MSVLSQDLRNSNTDSPPGGLKRVFGWGVLSLGISALCILAALSFLGEGNPFKSLLKVGLGTLAVSLAIVVVSWVVDGWRLSTLANAMGGRISLFQAVRISIMGSFMAGVTPFDTGGEPLKILFLHRRGGMSVGQATATVALAALMHATTKFALWVVAPVVAFFLGFSCEMPAAAQTVVVLGLIFYLGSLALIVASTLWTESVVRVAVWLFKTPVMRKLARPGLQEKVEKKVRGSAEDFRQGMLALRSNGAPAFAALALSVLHWALILAVPMFLLRSMGSATSWFQVFTLSLAVYLVTSYTPTPGGSGGAEVGSVVFFSPVLPAKILATFIVAWRAVTFYFTLLVGGFLVTLETVMWSARKGRLESD